MHVRPAHALVMCTARTAAVRRIDDVRDWRHGLERHAVGACGWLRLLEVVAVMIGIPMRGTDSLPRILAPRTPCLALLFRLRSVPFRSCSAHG